MCPRWDGVWVGSGAGAEEGGNANVIQSCCGHSNTAQLCSVGALAGACTQLLLLLLLLLQIVNCCGYDSVPFDLGVLLLADHARRHLGK